MSIWKSIDPTRSFRWSRKISRRSRRTDPEGSRKPIEVIIKTTYPGCGRARRVKFQALADQFGVDKEKITADTSAPVRSAQEMNARCGMWRLRLRPYLHADLHLVPFQATSRFAASAVLALVHDVLVVPDLLCDAAHGSVGSVRSSPAC